MNDNNGQLIPLVKASDLNAYRRIQAVIGALNHAEGINTITKACAEAGVTVSTFYQDLKNPTLNGIVLSEIRGRKHLEHVMLQAAWPEILRNMARIAIRGQDRDAIQATKLLREFGQDLESDIKEIEQPESGGKSTAQLILESFRGTPKVPKTLRRTIETQEIELGDPEDG